MSIDKIIERIRMIENNDFSKKENVISENIGLTSNERDTLFNTGSHVVSTIIQDYQILLLIIQKKVVLK